MPEPITIGTLLWGTATFIAGAAVGGVIEGQTEDIVKGKWQQFIENVRQYRPHENNELQLAVYRAYLTATLQVCVQRGEHLGIPFSEWLQSSSISHALVNFKEARRGDLPLGVLSEAERQWLNALAKDCIKKLYSIAKNEIELPKVNENEEIKQALQELQVLMQVNNSKEKIVLIRQQLTTKSLDEIEASYEGLPEGFKTLFEQQWFEYLCANFQYQIVRNQQLTNRFQSELLAKIITKENDLKEHLKRLGGNMIARLEETEVLLREQHDKINQVQAEILLPILALENDTNARVKRIEESTQELKNITESGFDSLHRRFDQLDRHTQATSIENSRKFICDLNLSIRIEGREKECETLFEAVTDENNEKRILCYTAPGGFGKSALLTKLCQKISESSNNYKRDITIPTIKAFLQLDCRSGLNTVKLFTVIGQVINKEKEFQELYNTQQLNLAEKFNQLFIKLSELLKGNIWIALDNFEVLLDEKSNIKNDELQTFFYQCFAGEHKVRLLIVSRSHPFISNHLRSQYQALDEIGKALFDGLPIENCIDYLREEGKKRGLNGIVGASDETIVNFCNRVHRIPMALVWVVGFLEDYDRTLQELLQNNELFEAFDRAQYEDSTNYLAKGLKRLHLEQLTKQPLEAKLVLSLLALFNRYVPRIVFEKFPDYSRTLTTLVKNNLVGLRESIDARIQAVGNDSQKRLYGLHSIISENDFFNNPPKQIVDVYEKVAASCLVHGTETSKDSLHYYALELFTCLEDICRYLIVKFNEDKFRGSLSAALSNKGVALMELGRLIESIKNHDEAIKIRELLTANEQQKNLQEYKFELAVSYMNRGGVLLRLGRLEEAINDFEKSTEILEHLLSRKYEEVKVEEIERLLALTSMNKGNALITLKHLPQTIAAYNLAVEMFERLFDPTGEQRFPHELGLTYMSRGNALSLLKRHLESTKDFDKAIEIFQKLIDRGQNQISNDLATAYVNKGVAYGAEGRFPEAVVCYEEAIKIREKLIKEKGRNELISSLATIYLNKGEAFRKMGFSFEAIDSLNKSIGILEPLISESHRFDLMGDLAKCYGSKAEALLLERKGNESVACSEQAVSLLEKCIFEHKWFHFAPMLIGCVMQEAITRLNLNQWKNSAEKIDYAINFLSIMKENNIAEVIYQIAEQEFHRCIMFLKHFPKENLEEIYKFLNSNEKIIRNIVAK